MKLIYTDTEGKDHTLELGASTTIGRSTDADVVMADEKASRMHFAIHEEDGAYILHDLQSRNGTFLNGVSVDVKAVKPGDQIRAGGTQFLLQGEHGAGPNTAINLVHDQMEEAGKGYGTMLREIVSDTKPKPPSRNP